MLENFFKEFKEHTIFFTFTLWFVCMCTFAVLERFQPFHFHFEKESNMKYFTNVITNENRMEELASKLKALGSPSYFHTDSGILELLYSHRDFKEYSDPIFRKIIRKTNQFLELVYMKTTYEIPGLKVWDRCILLQKDILNEMHALILNMPENSALEKRLYTAIDSMKFMLNLHMDQLRDHINSRIEDPVHHISKSKVQGWNSVISDPRLVE